MGRSLEEKEDFLVLVGKTISSVNVKEKLVVARDFNCHVGADALGFEGVHGGQGFGTRNVEGEMLLELASALGLVVVNTCFSKRDSHKVTFESGGARTVVDYVLVRRQDRAMVLDVKVMCESQCDKEGTDKVEIPEEPVLLQHRLIVCDLVMKEHVIQKAPVFVSGCKV